MIITIAVIFVLLATFLLIIFNMYSDYVARREQDSRLIAAKARNIIAECEELLLNRKFDSQVSRKIAKVLMYFIFLPKICYQYIVVMSVMCYYISILNFRGLDYALICFQN